MRALVLLMLVFPTGMTSAEPRSNPGETRAALHRAETYAVLLKHHWRVVSEQSDKLVAEQPCATTKNLAGPGIYPVDVARLTTKFIPQSVTHPQCDALILGFAHGTAERQDAAGNRLPLQRLANPIPLDTPEYKKDIQKMMAEAESHLIAAHPEFTGH